MDQDERDTLTDRMLKARTMEDISSAEKEADNWLEANPGDLQIIAARERLAKKAARVRDPERRANRVSMVVLLMVAFSVGLIVIAFTGDWKTTLWVSLVTGMSAGAIAWAIVDGIAFRGP